MVQDESGQTALDSFRTTGVGDRVTDKEEAPEVEPLRVVDPDVGTADEVIAGGQTVADDESNQAYPDDNRVVKAVYESELNGRVPDWKDMLGGEFEASLTEYSDEWNVAISMYHFPASRLKTIDDETDRQVETDQGVEAASGGEPV